MLRRFAVGLLCLCACKRPCEPWVSNGLAELSEGPAQWVVHCSPQKLRWRVTPGGTVDAFFDRLSSDSWSRWRLWNRRAMVRAGDPAVAVKAWLEGDDMLIELQPDPSIDVAAALASMPGRAP